MLQHYLASLYGACRAFARDRRGVTTIEYGILAAGLAVIIGALVADGGSFSETLSKVFENILDQLPQSSTGGGAAK
jgi:pilus assembly protein Flp/PilA